MEDVFLIYTTAAVILLYFFIDVLRAKFDPFEPIWLFLVGYFHVYVIQALSYHEWAVGTRGKELVWAANFRALWALFWFLAVYQVPLGRFMAGVLPNPPRAWSPKLVAAISPPLILWGLFCAGMMIQSGVQDQEFISAEESLFRSFPFVMLVAAILLIITGRTIHAPVPSFLPTGLLVGASYIFIWMFNGKRSHSLIGVLATICAFYIARIKRPSWPVLMATGFVGTLTVAIAIGWRGNMNYDRSFEGFTHFVGDFKVARILESLNMSDGEDDEETQSYETKEYGGFLLMMDTVPEKSGYDYGENYIRIFSTFIPRLVWPSKPIYGRKQWIDAWMAGSELEREDDFAGPAIGILGAGQLNGGAAGTLILLTCIAALLRTAYEYFRRHQDVPWAQFWWSITFFNSWLMVVADDPLAWFYYNWGFTTCPLIVLVWWANRRSVPASPTKVPAFAE
jgi:hypothetical protein